MKKKILVTLGAVGAALALAAAPAAAGTNVSVHDSTMADAIPSVWESNPYWATTSADYSQTTTENANWTIVSSTLTTTQEWGWVTTFVFTQKTPKVASPSRQASSSGTVTHTTSYGTSTEAFVAPAGTAAPFSVVGGNVVVDPYSPAADVLYAQQVAMVYDHGGQNAGWWFPAF